MKQYSYFDYSGENPVLVFSTKAENILDADALAKSSGVNIIKLSCLIGGRLVVTTTNAFTRSKLSSEQPFSYKRDGNTVLTRNLATFHHSVNRSLFAIDYSAGSLSEALMANKKKVSWYRYSPEHLFLWVVGPISTIVKNIQEEIDV